MRSNLFRPVRERLSTPRTRTTTSYARMSAFALCHPDIGRSATAPNRALAISRLMTAVGAKPPVSLVGPKRTGLRQTWQNNSTPPSSRCSTIFVFLAPRECQQNVRRRICSVGERYHVPKVRVRLRARYIQTTGHNARKPMSYVQKDTVKYGSRRCTSR
jgi:hypothetical protein